MNWKSDFGYFVMALISGMAGVSALSRLHVGASDIWWIVAGGCFLLMRLYMNKSQLCKDILGEPAPTLKEFWGMLINDPRRKRI